jgi:hypothetical protein
MFLDLINNNQIKENTTFIIDSNISTIKLSAGLEKLKDKKTLNWLIKLITLRRNRLYYSDDRIVINEEYDETGQQLKEIIDSLEILIYFDINITKKIFESLDIEELKQLHNNIRLNRLLILKWIKNRNLISGSKQNFKTDQYNLEFYFNIKNPFHFELNIIGI